MARVALVLAMAACGSDAVLSDAGTDAGDDAPPGQDLGAATLSVINTVAQPSSSLFPTSMVFVAVMLDGCPTLDASFGGTFRGAVMKVESRGGGGDAVALGSRSI